MTVVILSTSIAALVLAAATLAIALSSMGSSGFRDTFRNEASATNITTNSLDGQYEQDQYLIGDAVADQSGAYPYSYRINEQIDVTYRLRSPSHSIPAEVPVYVMLYNPAGKSIDNSTVYTNANGDAHYSFIPSELGDYHTVSKAAYNGISDEYQLMIKVRRSPEYAFTVEGKNSTATIDRFAEFNVTSVNIDPAQKKLSIEIEKVPNRDKMEVVIPYDLLGDPYTVFANGEMVDMGSISSTSGSIYKDYTFARLTVPVDSSITRIEIMGTTAIPEFGSISMLVMAAGIVSTLVALSRFSGRSRV